MALSKVSILPSSLRIPAALVLSVLPKPRGSATTRASNYFSLDLSRLLPLLFLVPSRISIIYNLSWSLRHGYTCFIALLAAHFRVCIFSVWYLSAAVMSDNTFHFLPGLSVFHSLLA